MPGCCCSYRIGCLPLRHCPLITNGPKPNKHPTFMTCTAPNLLAKCAALLLLCCISFSAHSQAPFNDNRANALSIPHSGFTGGTVDNATYDASSSCNSFYPNVWYKFVATSNYIRMEVDVFWLGEGSLVLQTAGGTLLDCSSGGYPYNKDYGFSYNNLVVGTVSESPLSQRAAGSGTDRATGWRSDHSRCRLCPDRLHEPLRSRPKPDVQRSPRSDRRTGGSHRSGGRRTSRTRRRAP